MSSDSIVSCMNGLVGRKGGLSGAEPSDLDKTAPAYIPTIGWVWGVGWAGPTEALLPRAQYAVGHIHRYTMLGNINLAKVSGIRGH